MESYRIPAKAKEVNSYPTKFLLSFLHSKHCKGIVSCVNSIPPLFLRFSRVPNGPLICSVSCSCLLEAGSEDCSIHLLVIELHSCTDEFPHKFLDDDDDELVREPNLFQPRCPSLMHIQGDIFDSNTCSQGRLWPVREARRPGAQSNLGPMIHMYIEKIVKKVRGPLIWGHC